jgi:hypothetical protein
MVSVRISSRVLIIVSRSIRTGLRVRLSRGEMQRDIGPARATVAGEYDRSGLQVLAGYPRASRRWAKAAARCKGAGRRLRTGIRERVLDEALSALPIRHCCNRNPTCSRSCSRFRLHLRRWEAGPRPAESQGSSCRSEGERPGQVLEDGLGGGGAEDDGDDAACEAPAPAGEDDTETTASAIEGGLREFAFPQAPTE